MNGFSFLCAIDRICHLTSGASWDRCVTEFALLSWWQMIKHTIAFELFPYPHTGEDLFQNFDYVITIFKLENKIFSMSFASNNTSAVEKLKIKYIPICNDVFSTPDVLQILLIWLCKTG
jgi:hypothetical protein